MRFLVEKLWVRRLLSLLTLAIVWELLARFSILDPFYFPPPSEILRVVFSLFAEGRILTHLEATFTAALAGLVIGVALGIFFGFAAALIPLVAELLEPVMMLLNAIPRVILAPLFVIWLGIGAYIGLSMPACPAASQTASSSAKAASWRIQA